MLPIINFDQIKTMPNPPVLVRGCEGECCGIIKNNIISKDTPLYQFPDKTSKIVSSLKKGVAFDKDKSEFFVRVNQFGSANVNGKKLSIIHSGSEGMAYYFDGSKANYTDDCVACLDEGKIDQADGTNKYKYISAQTESWLKIYYGKNNFGWTNEENFELGWCN